MAVTRRTIMTGTAWAVPAVTVAASAPALAASGCVPTLRASLGTTYDYGTIYSTAGNKTDQQLQLGGQTYVDNLPAGVTVTKITYQFWFQARATGTTGPGAFWMGDATSDKSGSCGSGACSVTWTPTAGSGFSPIVTSTSRSTSVTYPDGTARPSWDANMSWNASTAPGTYSAAASGCQNFTTGPSSRLTVNYRNVSALSTADVNNGKKGTQTYVKVTATLSDGTTLSRDYQTAL